MVGVYLGLVSHQPYDKVDDYQGKPNMPDVRLRLACSFVQGHPRLLATVKRELIRSHRYLKLASSHTKTSSFP